MSAYPHRVTYAIGNEGDWRFFPEIDRYDIACDMLDPSDGVQLVVPWSADVWALTKGDNQLNIWIDEQRVFSGIIDDRERNVSRSGSTVSISARDKAGRLVDESAPLIRFEGLGIVDLAQKLAGSLFQVTTSNATNRRLVTGRGGKTTTREPAIDRTPKAARKVEPGDSKADVLKHFLELGELIAWATSDGKSLVIGKPNYQQPVQWAFTISKPSSWNTTDVISYARRQSQAERYARIDAIGTLRGSEEDFGEKVRHRGSAKNGPNADGTGKDFRLPKRLIVHDDRMRAGGANDRAKREMAERDAAGNGATLEVWGHGRQPPGGTGMAIFAFDTLADIDDQEIPERGTWFLTAVRYMGGKDEGQTSELKMVPIGTDLRMA
jgi:prophage tail gpP-like protein